MNEKLICKKCGYDIPPIEERRGDKCYYVENPDVDNVNSANFMYVCLNHGSDKCKKCIHCDKEGKCWLYEF